MVQVVKEAQPQLTAFGLTVDQEVPRVQARLLPSPKLAYGHTAEYDPRVRQSQISCFAIFNHHG